MKIVIRKCATFHFEKKKYIKFVFCEYELLLRSLIPVTHIIFKKTNKQKQQQIYHMGFQPTSI